MGLIAPDRRFIRASSRRAPYPAHSQTPRSPVGLAHREKNRGRRAAVSARQGGGGPGEPDYAIALFRDVLHDGPDAPQQPHRAARLRDEEVRRARRRRKAKVEAFFKGIGPLVKMTLFRSKPEKVADAGEAYLVNDPTNIHVLVTLAKALERASHFEAAGRHARVRAPAQPEPPRRAPAPGRSALRAGPVRQVRALLPDDPEPSSRTTARPRSAAGRSRPNRT